KSSSADQFGAVFARDVREIKERKLLLGRNAPPRVRNSTESMKNSLTWTVLLFIMAAISPATEKTVVRVGHFPNITHMQGLVAHHLSRQGKGWFEARLGPEVEIQWFTYNAGPSAMEAIFAKSLDLTYVGPGPALNAYAKAQGEE